MDCSNAIDRLIEYLLTRKPAELDVADDIGPDVIGHIAGCRACIEELDAISSALTGEPSTLKEEADELLTLRQAQDTACQECLDALGAYVEDKVAGEDVVQLYPRVAGHLQGCSSCREQYEMLYEIMRQEEAGIFGEPPSYITFEEWFRLQHQEQSPRVKLPRPTRIPWRLDELGRLIIEFSAEWLRVLQPPAYQPAYATVKSAKSSRTLCQLSLKEAGEDLEVEITAEEMRDDPTLCTVFVDVNVPSRGGWPNLADTEVTLKRGERELGTQVTDVFGKAVFEEIGTDDLAYLVFEIMPSRDA